MTAANWMRVGGLLGAGLGLASAADAGVTLLSQFRSVEAVATSTRSDSDVSADDWSGNRLFYKAGTNGFWNGASQYSTFMPDGTSGPGESMLVEGQTRSEGFGGFAPATDWSASTTFRSVFRADEAQFIDIVFTSITHGNGSVTASLVNTGTGDVVWSGTDDDNAHAVRELAVGDYRLEIVASSSLRTSGENGDTIYSLGVGFIPVPAPGALTLLATAGLLARGRRS
ncbi:MAG: hypothetical protein RLZZ558_812 [Planctomycetota bacterium]|jgi:hypothetical protein